jgi:hypothetical protein
MKLPRRQFLHLAAGAAALAAMPRVARAQAWPTRVVRFVVGFPAGGGADATTRILAARLSELWGQQVVVENKGGAGGNLAHELVAHASPDGYTMLMGTNSVPVNPFLFPGLSFDPLTDLASVSLIGTYPNLMVVPVNAPAKTLPEFIARAKREKVTFATPGVGSSPHLAAELFKHMAKIDMTHVPYRGVAAGAMNDLLAGRLDAMFNTTGSLLPQFYNVPFSCHRIDPIKESLIGAGFTDINVAVVSLEKEIPDLALFARGLVYGNPLIDQIKARGGVDPDRVVNAVMQALRQEFGSAPGRMPLQAIVFSATKR